MGKKSFGFSFTNVSPIQGFIFGCEIIQQTPSILRERVVKLVTAKTSLLSRVDAFSQDPSGDIGRHVREEMLTRIQKWQEPPSPKIIKPLPMPDGARKKRRGGRRLRNYKERYGASYLSKATNRIGFNSQEEEIFEGDESSILGQNSSLTSTPVQGVESSDSHIIESEYIIDGTK